MRWKSSSENRVGWFDIIFADWYKAKYSGSMHSTSGIPFLFVLIFMEGIPSNTLLPPGRLQSASAYGACITVVYKGCQGVSDGFLFYTKKHPRNKINAEIRQGKTPRGAIRGKGKVKQYGFERFGNQKVHFR